MEVSHQRSDRQQMAPRDRPRRAQQEYLLRPEGKKHCDPFPLCGEILSPLLPSFFSAVSRARIGPRLTRRLEERKPGRPIPKRITPRRHKIPAGHYEATCPSKGRERTISVKQMGGIHHCRHADQSPGTQSHPLSKDTGATRA